MRRSFLTLIVLGLTGCAATPERTGLVLPLPHLMAPSKHIDLLYVAPGLKLHKQDILIVTKPKLAAPILERELTYTPWIKELHTALIQALRASGLFVEIASEVPSNLAGRKTLVLESAIVELDPGNQALRWWFGELGAGHSFIQVEGRIVTGQTQEILAEFADRRRGAGIFDITGGESDVLLREDLRGIAKDVAKALEAALQKEY